MSPKKLPPAPSTAVASAAARLWLRFGVDVRDLRLARRWSVDEVSRRAGVSRGVVYRVEAGKSVSGEVCVRVALALGRRPQLELVDQHGRTGQTRPSLSGPSLSVDAVHSAMAEFQADHLRGLGFQVGLDEPYQHFQFAGRADLVAWHVERAALLHIENRTRFPDFQDMAGSYNAKRAYLGRVLAERAGVKRWASETHVMVALWSAEVLHAIRLRHASFESLCPAPPGGFNAWWSGEPPLGGTGSTLVVLDPLAAGRQRVYISLTEALTARPRYRGYADAAARLAAAA